MSQASKSLKKIAGSEEYKALVGAIEAKDYEAVARSYLRLCQLVDEEKKQILDKIQSLPRQNKDEDSEKFQAAFSLRASTTLPQWHWLNSQLREQGVVEGEVFGTGTRGDPLVRTAQGRVVVITGAALGKGAKVKFKVVTPGQRLDFGRVIELNTEYFRFLLNREARDNMKKLFDAVEEQLRSGPLPSDETGLSRLSELLRGLEDARELTSKLDAVERDTAVARVLAYRRRLLGEPVVKLALDFIARKEEREIAEACGDEQVTKALTAPGLFRPQAYQVLKTELLAGDEVRGYSETLRALESRLDSMNAALELMEFQAGMEKFRPLARAYLERMDGLFERLQRKARQLAMTMAEGRVFSVADINSAIRDTFSSASLDAELRRTFRNAEEFHALRGALVELIARLNGKASLPAELALKPYLARKIAGAFEGSPVSGKASR